MLLALSIGVAIVNGLPKPIVASDLSYPSEHILLPILMQQLITGLIRKTNEPLTQQSLSSVAEPFKHNFPTDREKGHNNLPRLS
jgi:hypothetical protein